MKSMQKELVPFIKTGQALQSLRDSGYSIDAALGEVIDNSLEAKANSIDVVLSQGTNKSGKKCVSRIAIIDDGHGMPLDVLRYYLQIGYSTRYMSRDTIGKYGVGAKLAALNFARRFDAWSRPSNSDSWMHVYFDLDEALQLEEVGVGLGIKEPAQLNLPIDLQKSAPQKSGTIITWSKIDRLEEGRYAADFDTLKVEIEKELSRTFRYFIDGGIQIKINEKLLLAFDPLFLIHNTFADNELKKYYAKEDSNLGDHQPHFEPRVMYDEWIEIDKSKARLRVTLAPKEVIRKRGSGGDKLAIKLRLPDNMGAISFVRLQREVSYTNVPKILPAGTLDQDRFIGIELSFKPDLDEYFGVRNVKRGVEPHGELRAKVREKLKNPIRQARKEIDDIWGQITKAAQANSGEHALVIEAVKEANMTMPKSRVASINNFEKKQQEYDDLANDVVGPNEATKQEYKQKIKDLPFVIESIDFPGNQFIDIKHIDQQTIIRLNTRHRFYREMWTPIKEVASLDAGSVTGDVAVQVCKRTIETLTLLLVAYAKAESMNENPEDQYRELTDYWGQFLNTLMSKIKDII